MCAPAACTDKFPDLCGYATEDACEDEQVVKRCKVACDACDPPHRRPTPATTGSWKTTTTTITF